MKVLRTIVLGVAGACVVTAAVVVAVRNYLQAKEAAGEKVEKIFVDNLTIGEIKQWFEGKLQSEPQKGVVFYPTEDNIKKWNIAIPESQNSLIQIVYDTNKDAVVFYREIVFSEMSPKLSQLISENGGTMVIEK